VDHQQAEEQDQELESEEEESPIAESSMKHLKDLENFALTRSDSYLF
jgi:hypothetical protein